MREQLSPGGHESKNSFGMARFFAPRNLDRYRKLAKALASPDQRRRILSTLADELQAFKDEMQNGGRRPQPLVSRRSPRARLERARHRDPAGH